MTTDIDKLRKFDEASLVSQLRNYKINNHQNAIACILTDRAADALEAAEKRIAELEQQAEFDRKLQQLNRRDY